MIMNTMLFSLYQMGTLPRMTPGLSSDHIPTQVTPVNASV